MFSCTTDKYETLYAKWLSRPDLLLDWAAYDHRTDLLLDLCGGTGAISDAAAGRSPAVEPVLMDLNPRNNNPNVCKVKARVDSPWGISYEDMYTLIICRQAINYLNLNQLFLNLRSITRPQGRFVFNTFIEARSHLKTYRFRGNRYLEAAIVLLGRVIHLQLSPTIGWDVSVFKEYSHGDFMVAAGNNGWALVRRQVMNRAAYYEFQKVN